MKTFLIIATATLTCMFAAFFSMSHAQEPLTAAGPAPIVDVPSPTTEPSPIDDITTPPMSLVDVVAVLDCDAAPALHVSVTNVSGDDVKIRVQNSVLDTGEVEIAAGETWETEAWSNDIEYSDDPVRVWADPVKLDPGELVYTDNLDIECLSPDLAMVHDLRCDDGVVEFDFTNTGNGVAALVVDSGDGASEFYVTPWLGASWSAAVGDPVFIGLDGEVLVDEAFTCPVAPEGPDTIGTDQGEVTAILHVECQLAEYNVWVELSNTTSDPVPVLVDNAFMVTAGVWLDVDETAVVPVAFDHIEQNTVSVLVTYDPPFMDGAVILDDERSIECLRPNPAYEFHYECGTETAAISLQNNGLLPSTMGFHVAGEELDMHLITPGGNKPVALPIEEGEPAMIDVYADGEVLFHGEWAFTCINDLAFEAVPTPGGVEPKPDLPLEAGRIEVGR